MGNDVATLAIAIPIYRSLHRPEPRNPQKSLKKVWPGLPAQSVKKVSKKSPNTRFRLLLDSFSGPLGLLRHFFGTPGREAREDLFETFVGFWGQRAPGLLYMAVPIATQPSDFCRSLFLRNSRRRETPETATAFLSFLSL